MTYGSQMETAKRQSQFGCGSGGSVDGGGGGLLLRELSQSLHSATAAVATTIASAAAAAAAATMGHRRFLPARAKGDFRDNEIRNELSQSRFHSKQSAILKVQNRTFTLLKAQGLHGRRVYFNKGDNDK